MTLIQHEFGPEAIAYLRSYLANNERRGKRLGKLIARRDLEAGTVWSFVPPESSPETLANLTDEPLFASTPIVFDEHGHSWQRKHDPWKDPEVIEWLDGLLARPEISPWIVCSEDVRASRTDSWVAEHPEYDLFFCGDEVYMYASDGSVGHPADAIADAAGHAVGNPSVGIVTTLPPDSKIENRRSLTEQTLEEMAAGAVAVVVGAWDEEGFLVWEPARP